MLIIQVKAIVHQKSVAEKIVEYFERVDDFLESGKAVDGKSDIKWWTKNCKVRKMVVYDYYSPPSYIKILTDNKIEVINFKDIFNQIVKEQNAVMRLIHFLDKNNYLTQTKPPIKIKK